MGGWGCTRERGSMSKQHTARPTTNQSPTQNILPFSLPGIGLIDFLLELVKDLLSLQLLRRGD